MSTLAKRLLEPAEIATELKTVDGWSVLDGMLTKTFSFKAYKDGVVFTSTVAYLADKLNHHPDLYLSYGKLVISVNTHDVGGLSPYDFELARRIDSL